MRCHVVLLRIQKPEDWYDCYSAKATYIRDKEWTENWIADGLIARVEDMKTRTVIFSTFRLQDEAWFASHKNKLASYRKCIRYWNRKLHPEPKDKLSALRRKHKTWARRFTIARKKLTAINRQIKRQETKLCQLSTTNTLNHTSKSAASCPATTSALKS